MAYALELSCTLELFPPPWSRPLRTQSRHATHPLFSLSTFNCPRHLKDLSLLPSTSSTKRASIRIRVAGIRSHTCFIIAFEIIGAIIYPYTRVLTYCSVQSTGTVDTFKCWDAQCSKSLLLTTTMQPLNRDRSCLIHHRDINHWISKKQIFL
jgi:hypothetical protein